MSANKFRCPCYPTSFLVVTDGWIAVQKLGEWKAAELKKFAVYCNPVARNCACTLLAEDRAHYLHGDVVCRGCFTYHVVVYHAMPKIMAALRYWRPMNAAYSL